MNLNDNDTALGRIYFGPIYPATHQGPRVGYAGRIPESVRQDAKIERLEARIAELEKQMSLAAGILDNGYACQSCLRGGVCGCVLSGVRVE